MSVPSADVCRSAHYWRAKVDDGDLLPQEQRDFECWLTADPSHSDAFLEAGQLWQALGAIDYPPSLDRPLPLEHLRNCLRGWTQMLAGIKRPLAGGFGLLSLACCVIVIATLLRDSPIDPAQGESSERQVYLTSRGEVEVISLADGSRITLGAHSHIEVAISAEQRQVRLRSGVAFFDVSRLQGREFVVTVGDASIRVLGTSFDVKNKADGVFVAVEEGVVRVSYPKVITDLKSVVGQQAASINPKGEVTLLAGQSVTALRSQGLGRVDTMALSSVGAWRTGQLVYKQATLGEIVEDVNRYTYSPIKVGPSVKQLTLSGTFKAGDSAELLELLQAALPVRIEDRSGVLFIVGE